MAQSVLPIYIQVLFQGGLPLHSALIEKEGMGMIIAAPSGTGKSTCTNRIHLPWKAMCDDEVLIVRDKNDIYHSHPFPTWSRFNKLEPREIWNVQSHVPISAIFFLKKSQKDDVTPISFSQSALLIYKLSLPVFSRILGSINPEEQVRIKKLIFENACDIAKNIPSFILDATLTGKFWEVIDKALSMKPGRYADPRLS
jgi:SynChlorMet cassette protein ScmC